MCRRAKSSTNDDIVPGSTPPRAERMTSQLADASARVSLERTPPHLSQAEVRYRPDIDGLRALAVVPVVLFHAGFGWVSGGFVGVDVFFVISGFLITSILAREIAEKRYSIIEFYRRRALRIFPALAAMTLTTIAAGYFILTPAEYVDLAKASATVAAFSSNIYFWKSISYFNNGNAFQPLLHTWSLAVEEQYYVFFPLVLRLVSPRRKMIAGTLWFILLASLGLAILLVPIKPNLAFYLLPTRAWELMLGGLVAIGGLPKAPSNRVASIASLIGLALIAAPMVLYSASTPFPGIAALPPTIGTALIIWSGGRALVGSTLSMRPIVLVGQASYSIYLWHLPLLAYAVYLMGGHIPLGVSLAICIVSVALGFTSLALVERPFRTRAQHRTRMAIAATSGMVMVAVVSVLIIVARGLPARLNADQMSIVSTAADKYKHHAECMTLDQSVVAPEHACRLGTPHVNPTILLWGDSHAMVTATALQQAALRRHGAFLFAADADCPPGLGFDIDPHFDPGLTSQLSYRYCPQYNAEMLKLALASPDLKTVVLSSRWTNWRIGEPPNPSETFADVRLHDSRGTAISIAENKQKWERGFLALIDRLTEAQKKVVIVGPLPEPNFDVPHQLYIAKFGFVSDTGPLTIQQYTRRHHTILSFFGELRKKRGVSFVWPTDILCVADKCPLVDRGHVMFFDQDHLSVYAARKTASLYDRLFS